MTKELIETMEKQIGNIEKAISKFTTATNAHDMARRHGINEARNQLAGDVYETRQQLESILSTVTDELGAAKASLCSVCGDQVDTREVEDGGTPHGCNVGNDEWVCSSECYDAMLMKEHAPQGLGS